MSKTTIAIAISVIATAALTTVAFAHGHRGPHGFGHGNGGPMCQNLTTVQHVLDNCKDDDFVRLQGKLTKQLSHDKYEFVDNTGKTIIVELDDDENWSHIGKGELIDICGKVDKDPFEVSIDVKNARKAIKQKISPTKKNGLEGLLQGLNKGLKKISEN